MKNKLSLLALSTLLTLSLQAENLIFNADLTKLKSDKVATAWNNVGKLNITYSSKNGSQEGMGYAEFVSGADKALGSIRQSLRNKVEVGKKYRLSADFKGENFKADDYGFLLINTNWKGNVGLRRFKLREDGKWRTMSKVITVPDNWTSVTAVVFATNMQGKLYVSNIKCEPAAE